MAKRKRWAVVSSLSGEFSPAAPAFAAQLHGEDTYQWPAEPAPEHVRVLGATDAPYAVDVAFVRDSSGELVPVGVSVRRTFPWDRRTGTAVSELEPLSAVDVRAIPFGRVIRAALTAVNQPEMTDERHAELERILVPRGRPQRGRSEKFYRDIAKAVQACQRLGLSPAKEIARRKPGVSENLVHQWVHVARRRGLLNQPEEEQ